MSQPKPKPKSTEFQREREVQRYLQSWQVAQGSPLNVATNVENIALVELHGSNFVPQASPDKALSAFIQLAVLRLNAKRGMISLIDGKNQYILAEATQTLSLEDVSRIEGSTEQQRQHQPRRKDPTDVLWRMWTAETRFHDNGWLTHGAYSRRIRHQPLRRPWRALPPQHLHGPQP
jgi:hypothetical protein